MIEAGTRTPEFVVIGVGGLGCPALLGLLAGGVERVTLVDDDVVESSNLQRQVLFSTADVGRPKVSVAAWALRERCVGEPPTITCRRERIDPARADAWVAELPRDAIVLECTDDPALEFAIHDACMARARPLVVGGVLGFRGQVMAIDPRRSDRACFRCLFEAPPPRELAPACASVGVLGAVAGLLGQWMALLALRLAGPARELDDDPADGTLIAVDMLRGALRRLSPPPRPDCPACSIRAASLRNLDDRPA
ncbi:HesA/MoeB/ThiF family protein [Nannocystaceae bacterium ST9]